jgi:hypothetical protein
VVLLGRAGFIVCGAAREPAFQRASSTIISGIAWSLRHAADRGQLAIGIVLPPTSRFRRIGTD